MKKYLFFVDLDKAGNLEHGLEYYAAGFVFNEHPNCPSGKELGVTYMSPFGVVTSEWRSRSEVDLIEVSKADYENLRNSLAEA